MSNSKPINPSWIVPSMAFLGLLLGVSAFFELTARNKYMRGTDRAIDNIVTALEANADSVHFDQVVAQLPQCYIVCEKNGRIKTVNKGFERVCGFSGSEVVGMCVCEVIPEKYQESHRRMAAKGFPGQPMGVWTITPPSDGGGLRTIDGREIPGTVYVCKIKMPELEPIIVIEFFPADRAVKMVDLGAVQEK